jgi:hypothetical protein
MLEPPFTCLCRSVLHGGLAKWAQRSCYTSTWKLLFWDHVTYALCPLIPGVHNRSQTEIGAPTLSLMLIRKAINLEIWMKCTSLYCSQLGRVAHLGMSIGHPQKFLLALHQYHLPQYGL